MILWYFISLKISFTGHFILGHRANRVDVFDDVGGSYVLLLPLLPTTRNEGWCLSEMGNGCTCLIVVVWLFLSLIFFLYIYNYIIHKRLLLYFSNNHSIALFFSRWCVCKRSSWSRFLWQRRDSQGTSALHRRSQRNQPHNFADERSSESKISFFRIICRKVFKTNTCVNM